MGPWKSDGSPCSLPPVPCASREQPPNPHPSRHRAWRGHGRVWVFPVVACHWPGLRGRAGRSRSPPITHRIVQAETPHELLRELRGRPSIVRPVDELFQCGSDSMNRQGGDPQRGDGAVHRDPTRGRDRLGNARAGTCASHTRIRPQEESGVSSVARWIYPCEFIGLPQSVN